MKTVVITGSARGFGFEMAKVFKKNDFNVVLSDVNKEELKLADAEIGKIESKSGVLSAPCDVTSPDELNNLWNKAKLVELIFG